MEGTGLELLQQKEIFMAFLNTSITKTGTVFCRRLPMHPPASLLNLKLITNPTHCALCKEIYQLSQRKNTQQ